MLGLEGVVIQAREDPMKIESASPTGFAAADGYSPGASCRRVLIRGVDSATEPADSSSGPFAATDLVCRQIAGDDPESAQDGVRDRQGDLKISPMRSRPA